MTAREMILDFVNFFFFFFLYFTFMVEGIFHSPLVFHMGVGPFVTTFFVPSVSLLVLRPLNFMPFIISRLSKRDGM